MITEVSLRMHGLLGDSHRTMWKQGVKASHNFPTPGNKHWCVKKLAAFPFNLTYEAVIGSLVCLFFQL